MRAGLLGLLQRLRGAALPIEASRHSNRVLRAFGDLLEVRGGGGRIVQVAKRHPAGGELVLGAVIVPCRRRGVAGDDVGPLRIVLVEQLAHQQAALDPPLVKIVTVVELRDGGHQRGRFGGLVGAPQHLDLGELVADVVVRGGRHGFDQFLVAALAEHGDARLGDRRLVAAEPCRGAHPGLGVVLLVEAAVHPRLVVGAGEELAELLLHLQFDLLGDGVGAPHLAHQRLRALAVALREQRAGQRQLALGAERLVAAEVGADGGRVMPVLEQDGLGLAAQRRDARPARVGVDESHVAGKIRAAVVVAQDRPFDQLLRHRVGDRVLRLVRLGAAAAAQMVKRALRQRDVDCRGRSPSRGTWGRAEPQREAPAAGTAASGSRPAAAAAGRAAGSGVAAAAAWRARSWRSFLAAFDWRLSAWPPISYRPYSCRPWACRISSRPSRASSPPACRRLGVAWAAASMRDRRTRTSPRPRANPATSASSTRVTRRSPIRRLESRLRSQYLFR